MSSLFKDGMSLLPPLIDYWIGSSLGHGDVTGSMKLTLLSIPSQTYEHTCVWRYPSGMKSSTRLQPRLFLSLQVGAGAFVFGIARASSIPIASGHASWPRNRPIAPPIALAHGDTMGYGSTHGHGHGIGGLAGFSPNGSTRFPGLFLA